MKKVISGYSAAELKQEFYSNVRSENDLASYTIGTEVGDDDYYFGEMKDNGDFTIKHHVPEAKASKVEFGRLYVVGRMAEDGEKSRIEYEYRHHAMPLEMLCAVLAVAVLVLVMTMLKDVVAGLIWLGVMIIACALIAVAPIERARFKRLIQKIARK